MQGVIVNYRGSYKTQRNHHMVLAVKGITTRKEAETLLKKTVVWTSPAGKKLEGLITQPHGNKGAVRAYFSPGLPGQALGAQVEVA